MQLPAQQVDLLQLAVEVAHLLLEETGRLAPMLAVMGDHKGVLLQLNGWTPRNKLALMQEAGRQAAALNPQWVALIADVYFKETPAQGEPPPWPLPEDTEAREALSVCLMDRQGRTAVCVRPYRRLPSPEGVRLAWEDPLDVPPGAQIGAAILDAFWKGVQEASR